MIFSNGVTQMISFRHRGDFRKTERLLKKSLGRDYMNVLHQYGAQGVRLLSSNTPLETGETAASWSYEIVKGEGRISVFWNNSHVEKGCNIAVILQYGHATRNGGWVEGRDYINPALQPIFDQMAEKAWKEVISV